MKADEGTRVCKNPNICLVCRKKTAAAAAGQFGGVDLDRPFGRAQICNIDAGNGIGAEACDTPIIALNHTKQLFTGRWVQCKNHHRLTCDRVNDFFTGFDVNLGLHSGTAAFQLSLRSSQTGAFVAILSYGVELR